jgi:tetratricopeptide (TPR) repeat protein
MVTYPNRPDKGKPSLPGIGGGNGSGLVDRSRPGNNKPSIIDRNPVNRDKLNIGDRNYTHIENINVGRKNVGLNRPSTLRNDRHDWNPNKWGGNNSVWGNKVNIGNNVNININNSFRNNNNFAYRPNCWGARPWWGASNHHHWHHGHWGYGWNSGYYHRHWYYHNNSFARGFMWGIGVWSLGNMIYDMGYHSYRNPYPAPPVQNTYITYAQPVSVAAAANPPGDEEVSATAESKSSLALEASRTAFKAGDYLTALKSADEALSYTPGDVTLHEYRSLVYFALGKYSDAAGVLNTVLASGPGWSWDTMVGFYNGTDAYNEQLKKLEDYGKTSGKADGHFLLGYHYMVGGHMEESNREFTQASELEPRDSISRQLAALTADSIPDVDGSNTEPPVAPDPVPVDRLVGTWVNTSESGTITFGMKENGDYDWQYKPAEGESVALKGTYGLDEQGLLVLTSDDTQMVSEIVMKEGNKMHFTLIGSPDGDPGLDFTKS